MPRFYFDQKYYITTYISGPVHIYLGVSFDKKTDGPPVMLQRPALGHCTHEQLDESQIQEAVLAGVEEYNCDFGTGYAVSEIVYVENDTPKYDIFQKCAYLIVDRIEKGDEFCSIESKW